MYNTYFTGIRNCGNGITYHYVNGQFHREDGPAIEYSHNDYNLPNYKAWFINNICIGTNYEYVSRGARVLFIKNNEEFLRLIKLKCFW